MMKNENKKTIKVLHIVGSMHPGGMENFVMNIYENIDREKYHFDFAEHAIKENGYDDRIRELGGKVFLLPRLTKNPVKSLKDLKKIIHDEKYDIVIRHTPNALIAPQLMMAKKEGAITVCHSHNTTDPKKFLHIIGKILLKKCVDVRLACSESAGKWMFGNQNYEVVKNAIDINKFAYNKDAADKVVAEFNLHGRHIYGHVANFIESKNHGFLLEIFKEITKLDERAVLICLGDGSTRLQIETKIRDLGLEDKVILTGIRKDVEAFMSAFEVMIFPSFFEGLPLTLIEAQISGLPICMSDTITDEVIITENLVTKYSIEKPAIDWAKKVIKMREENKPRICQIDNVRKNGYDLKLMVSWYQQFLSKLVEEK